MTGAGRDGADRAVPGTGLGILRHDRVGPGSFAALPDEVKARALDPQRLIVTKANSRSTVHRPSYLDYVAVKRLSPDGKVVGEYRFLGLYTHAAFSESIKSIPVLRRKLAEVLAVSGHGRRQPRRQGSRRGAGLLSARRAVHGLGGRAGRRSPRACTCCASGGRPGCSCARTSTAGTSPAWSTCRGTGTPPRSGCGRRRSCSGRSAPRQVDYSVLVGESPVARLHLVVRAERGRQLPDADRPRWSGRSPPRSGPGTTTWPTRRRPRSARSGPGSC